MKNKVGIQTLILGAGQVGGKILSLIFLFRFSKDIKDIGLYLYTYAYIPFSLFLDLSSFGIIPGVAKIVSKLFADKQEEKIRYLLKKGSIYSIGIGIVFFILLNIFNDKILAVSLYKGYTENEYKIILMNLKISSYSLFIFPLFSFYKGYLQGHLRMMPSALAILLENVIRVILYLYYSRNIDVFLIQKVFSINFISYCSATIFLFLFIFKEYFQQVEKFKLNKALLENCGPFGIVMMFFTFYQLIDTISLSSLGIDSYVYTAYMFESIRLIFIPIVFSQSIGGFLSLRVNYFLQKEKIKEARNIAALFTNGIIYILIPIVVLYRIYAKELYSFFYHKEELYFILSDTAFLIFFIGFYKVIIEISQGMSKFSYIVISTFISILSKAILNIIIVPYFGYQGAIFATTLSISICMLVSYFVMYKAKIYLFFTNIKSGILSIISVFFASYLATIFRVGLFLNSFAILFEIFLFTILFFLFYILILSFVNVIGVSKAKKIS